jgi:hypothetical protein
MQQQLHQLQCQQQRWMTHSLLLLLLARQEQQWLLAHSE